MPSPFFLRALILEAECAFLRLRNMYLEGRQAPTDETEESDQ
ncbi:MAG TPA: hypothetical protein VEI97_08135 [bacterium]|nr:hypothetical protein [bacterium]